MDQLAKHEQAAEEVYRAFAHYWLGTEGQYVTKLIKRDVREEFVRKTNYINSQTGEKITTPPPTPVFFGQPGPRFRHSRSFQPLHFFPSSFPFQEEPSHGNISSSAASLSRPSEFFFF